MTDGAIAGIVVGSIISFIGLCIRIAIWNGKDSTPPTHNLLDGSVTSIVTPNSNKQRLIEAKSNGARVWYDGAGGIEECRITFMSKSIVDEITTVEVWLKTKRGEEIRCRSNDSRLIPNEEFLCKKKFKVGQTLEHEDAVIGELMEFLDYGMKIQFADGTLHEYPYINAYIYEVKC